MKVVLLITLLSLICVPAVQASSSSQEDCPAALSFDVKQLADDSMVNLCSEYKGKVVLIVNTASKCGFTPQYDGLEALYDRYRDRGFVVLGFPSNDFGQQEPGDEAQIKEFCRLTYGVRFPMFAKTQVREDNADPLYRTLGSQASEYPRWNFHKYLLDRDGKLVGSFASRVDPESPEVVARIEKLL